MFAERAKKFKKAFKKISFLPPASDRKSWEELPSDWKASLIKAGEKRLGWNFLPISATLYMDFKRSGNRERLEKVYFEKRCAFADLVLAECVEGKGRFLDDIINGIFSIWEESAWQLPAHNSYIRDTPQELLPDKKRPILDLFACETGASLAVAYGLLGASFDQVHPFLNSNLLDCLIHRILIPYLKEHFWWMGQGEEPMCNWTVWCTQNILLTVFLLPDSLILPSFSEKETDQMQTIRRNVFEKACQSIDFFLKDYGEDGCCEEGAQYYRHAGLCLFHTLEILNDITGNYFSDFYQNPKIVHIAEYILNVHIDSIYYVNYADCSPVAGFAGVREFLFGKHIGNPNMMNFAAKNFKQNPDKLLSREINLFYHVENALTYSEIMKYDTSLPVVYRDIYYESVGVFIARDDSDTSSVKQKGLFLAMKAGDNNDSHNHNDTGSFLIYKNGLPLFIDVGVETYTKKTFSPQRYEIWVMQSQYHNLPTINGVFQQDGALYRASNVTYQLKKNICSICMDIASAYPKEANIVSYIREATLVKGKQIYIKDCYQFPEKGNHQLLLSFMTYEKPVTEEEAFQEYRIQIGSLGSMRLKGVISVQTEEIPIQDERLKTAWKHEIYRIQAAADFQSGQIEMEIW